MKTEAPDQVLARMGWNPASPTAELRVSLLAYLRTRHPQASGAEQDDLQRWITWLDGGEVVVTSRQVSP